MTHKLLKRRYLDKGVFFEIYENGLVILKANGKELARKVLNRKDSGSQIEEAFKIEIENLRAQKIIPSPYGFKAYYKPSLGKIVFRKPHSVRKKRKAQKELTAH